MSWKKCTRHIKGYLLTVALATSKKKKQVLSFDIVSGPITFRVLATRNLNLIVLFSSWHQEGWISKAKRQRQNTCREWHNPCGRGWWLFCENKATFCLGAGPLPVPHHWELTSFDRMPSNTPTQTTCTDTKAAKKFTKRRQTFWAHKISFFSTQSANRYTTGQFEH